MAALAGMTVVVEAAQRSGSLITADLAADLGRDLGAVPGPVNSRASAGTNDLLAGGACLVRDAQDVLDAMLGPGVRRAERAGPRLEPALLGVLAAVERGEETCDASPPSWTSAAPRPPRLSPRWRRSATSPARWSASTRERCSRGARCLGIGPRLRGMESERIPAVLSIAGSDSGGGAGIQADLKAFARCGVHGMTAITAITAQNTVGVEAVEAVSPETIVAQVGAVAEDIGVDAVKIGMLGTAETVDAVVEALGLVGEAPVVVDPVMVAESGAVLLDEEARAALVERLLPLATVVTPNIPEARALAGAEERDSQEDLAREVLALGPRAVVVTGGHSERVVDLFFDGRESAEIAGERHPDGAAHGSGCTHSSALAAFLALGETPLEAARKAREVASAAVAAGLREIGDGPGPGRRLRPSLKGCLRRTPKTLQAGVSRFPA